MTEPSDLEAGKPSALMPEFRDFWTDTAIADKLDQCIQSMLDPGGDESMSYRITIRAMRRAAARLRQRSEDAERYREVRRNPAMLLHLIRLEGPFRLLIAACNRLSEEAEEYNFDDGMGRGALQNYWDEFEDALEKARDVIGNVK